MNVYSDEIITKEGKLSALDPDVTQRRKKTRKPPRNVTVPVRLQQRNRKEEIMPRMSKRQKEEWAFFLNENGCKTYNELCRRCVRDCKQSFRAMVVQCPKYRSKRAVSEVMRD